MIQKVFLDDTVIHPDHYQEEKIAGLQQICIDFKVTSEEYHDITTLLYKGTFEVKVPEKGLKFTGNIQKYSTSITNLYQKGQVGEFKLCLREVKDGMK
ncbi:DUF3219 family protein [Virgibacillus sp. W0181]|uniref:DUF3219 family protein n=1 Tax=Virgibacillus sp. W0181 TaxID=3391581 RepID=UPI003F48C45D